MTVTALNVRNENLQTKTGYTEEQRKAISEKLTKALASTYVLYHKTQAFHWNVTGPMFYTVHKMTEAQYQDQAKAIDALAERIRTLGSAAPMGLAQYIENSVVTDAQDFPAAGEMLTALAEDNQRIASLMRNAVATAEQANDVYTADMLTARIGAHEEAAWMLSATAAK